MTIYRRLLENFLMGGISGSMILPIFYPWENRTILADDTKSAQKCEKRLYSGMADVYRQTLATDGVAGLYRGFAISCFGIFIYRGIYFGLYDTFKPLLGASKFLASFFTWICFEHHGWLYELSS
jgi:solute carrier family 25 (adenine nucleotide translocator) protein 4/5/6/31